MAEDADAAGEYALGIDVGSTSIKATLVRRSDSQSVAEQRLECAATYAVNDGVRSEQNVAALVEYVDRCVRALPVALLNRVVAIGICGQMHGVVCWSSEDRPWSAKPSPRRTDDDDDGVFADESKVSRHYTWQDRRCSPDFLASLPTSRSHLSVHTGYGCATLFWLKANDAETLRRFDRAATIADFVVAMLCDSDVPQTSPQNAASWGYFDAETDRFEESVLRDAHFPVGMLPRVRPDNGVAGTLRRPWRGLRAGVVVGVALGDLQAFVLAVLRDENEAVVNVSTSAQMVFVDRDFAPSRPRPEKTAAKVVPYFDGKYLHEGAAINGGNALSLFVDFIAESARSLGCDVSEDRIWRRLIEESQSRSGRTDDDWTRPSPVFVPTFWGERRSPSQRASICQLTPDNFNSIALFRALCAGIVDNIHELVPLATLRRRGIEKIVATGTAVSRNETLLSELRSRYAPLPVHSQRSASADSAVGSALAVLRLLDRTAGSPPFLRPTDATDESEPDATRRVAAYLPPTSDE